MNLENKRILITGASSGLGKAMAKVLISKGANVLITGRDADKVKDVAHELGCWGLASSIASEDAILALFAAIDSTWGGIDILINNAGIGYFHPVEEVQWAHLEEIFHTNVFGAALAGREAAIRMKAQSSGHIINVASTAGSRGFKNGTVYAASKFALKGMTQCWMHELRPHNIRVTLLSPSAVPTAFNVESREEKDLKDGLLTPNELAHAVVSVLEMDNRGFIPELEVWATNPF
ncbi:SDR family NAD(P)-dependent oxidoreductase [Schleiferiaceae bacterium]|nr:SDR family NAD(P)-dependent oxidoreductase [Schleiferiaceae bacterium]